MPSLGSEITVISEDQNTDIIVTLSDADGEFFANAAAGYADKALQYKNTVEALTSRAQTSADTATARANEARASAQNAVTAAEGASNSEFTAGEYANSALEYMQSASNSRNSAALSASQARGYATQAQQAYENTIALNAVVGIEESVVESGGLNPYTGEKLTITKANGNTEDIDLLVKLYNDIGSSVTGAMTQRAVTTSLELKQDKLTAGANITIDANNVISATGGGGGGAVDSVNGQTGTVVLDAEDVGALPDTTTASDLGAYVKPTGGIPKTDLASAVQTSLGKADTALQSAPVSSVNTKTGAVTLTASDVGALSSSTAYVSSVNGNSGAVTVNVPTKTSDLTNDSGFLTSAPVSSVDGKTGAVTVIPTGGATGQVLAKASATDRDVEWVDQSGGSSSKTAVIFAASDSDDEFKASADYVCTGTNDQILINSAMEQNTEFVFMSGTYNISGEINPVSNSTLRGVGYPTFKLANRTTSNLSASASIGDSEIYVTDPSVFVLGQKIQIKESNQYDQIGIILSIDTATGRITFSKNGDPSQTGTLSKNFTTSAVVFSDPSIVMGWSVENVTVEGIKLDGNRSNLAGYTSDSDYGSNAIEFYGGKGIRVCNNIITDVYKHGILFVYGTADSVIENNAVSNCSTHGIDLFDSVKYIAVAKNSMNSANIQCHNGSYSSIVGNTLVKCSIFHQGTAKYNTIVGNVIDNTLNNSARNFQFNGNAVNDILIANNVTYGGNYGIQIDGGRRISLIGNYFAAAKSQAVHLYNTQLCNVSDNDIDGCNATNTGAGILLEMTCLRNKISNNFIKGTSGKTEYGVQEKTSASNYNYINGNVAYSATAAVSTLGANTVETGNAVMG